MNAREVIARETSPGTIKEDHNGQEKGQEKTGCERGTCSARRY
jgi:hypothetical protein